MKVCFHYSIILFQKQQTLHSQMKAVILMAPGFRQPEHLADLPLVFLVKNRSCSECLNLSCASNCLQNTLALMEDNIFRCSGISEGVLALSHKIHYLQTLLAPNVDHFCLSNKCSSNTRWCDISFYLPFAETNNFYIVICILTLYQ